MISSVTGGSYLTIQVLTFLYIARDACMSPNPGVRIQGITFQHKGGIQHSVWCALRVQQDFHSSPLGPALPVSVHRGWRAATSQKEPDSLDIKGHSATLTNILFQEMFFLRKVNEFEQFFFSYMLRLKYVMNIFFLNIFMRRLIYSITQTFWQIKHSLKY